MFKADLDPAAPVESSRHLFMENLQSDKKPSNSYGALDEKMRLITIVWETYPDSLAPYYCQRCILSYGVFPLDCIGVVFWNTVVQLSNFFIFWQLVSKMIPIQLNAMKVLDTKHVNRARMPLDALDEKMPSFGEVSFLKSSCS